MTTLEQDSSASPDTMTPDVPLPVQLMVAEPAQQPRWTVLIRGIMLLPQYLVLYFLSIAFSVVQFIGWWGALFTGRLPEFAWTFLSGYMRWTTRVQAYGLLLTDQYPPFSLEDEPDYPVRIAVPPAGKLNRAAVFFRFILVIPASLLSSIVGFGAATIVGIIAWVITLITGKLPTPLHQAYTAVLRYTVRVSCYASLLTAAYPAGLFGDGLAEPAVPPAGDLDAAVEEAPDEGVASEEAPADAVAAGDEAPADAEASEEAVEEAPEAPVDAVAAGDEAPADAAAPGEAAASGEEAPVDAAASGEGASADADASGDEAPVAAEAPVDEEPHADTIAVDAVAPADEAPADAAAPGDEAPADGVAPVDETLVDAVAPLDETLVDAFAPIEEAAPGEDASVDALAPADALTVDLTADWRLLLTRGARQLLGWFIAIGAVLWVGYIVAITLIVAHQHPASAKDAVAKVNAANATLASALNSYATTVQGCTNAGCAESADTTAATDFTNFGNTVHGVPMPGSAVADANAVYADATKVAHDLTALSHLSPTVSAAQYSSDATSLGIAQDTNKFQQDSDALDALLNTLAHTA